jgi:putative (di)nucleoside polyphosphate hydrolase
MLGGRVIDAEGFRIGVGIIIANANGQVLWARRIGQHAWQFPQGGMQHDETPEQTLFRELYEELGLENSDVKLLGGTKNWLQYWLPPQLRRAHIQPLCIGQKQKWFLLYLTGNPEKIRFNVTRSPEFDRWRWAPYWYPIKQVITFKRHVYRRALEELSPLLPNASIPLKRINKYIDNATTILEKVD